MQQHSQPVGVFGRLLRCPDAVAGAVIAAAVGLAIARMGPGSPWILAPVAGVWAVVAMSKIGTAPLVYAAMMGVAFTAPMNGLRVLGVLAATDVLLAVAILGLLLETIVDKRRWRPLPAGFTAGTALVVAGGLLGTLFAESPVRSLAHLVPFALAVTVPVIVFQMWGPSLPILRRYAWCWVLGAAASGVVGLLSTGGVTGRPEGLTPHPNHLAMTCALGAVLALALRLGEVGWRKHLALALVGVLALTVVRAGSRAALITLLVGAVVLVFRTRDLRPTPERIGRGALALLILGLLAGALLGTGAVRIGKQNAVVRLLGDPSARGSNAQRLSLLDENFRRIESRPLTGSGFEKALEAHNIYVQVLAAAGIVGLVGFLMVVTSVVLDGARPGTGRPDRLLVYLRTAFLASYVGYLIGGLAQNILWDRYVWLHVAVIVWARAAVDAEDAVAPCT